MQRCPRSTLFACLNKNDPPTFRPHSFGAQERERLAELSADGPLDARAALEFAKEWNEGMAMDLQYATRRNKGNYALRARFENFMSLQEAAKTVEV